MASRHTTPPPIHCTTRQSFLHPILVHAADDGKVGLGSRPVHKKIKQGKYQVTDHRHPHKQGEVGEAEQKQELANHGEGKGQVDTGGNERQEKHREDLGIDASADVFPGHTHLLHNGKPGLVLVALGNLLVVDNQHRRKDEHDAQKDAQEEQSAVHAVQVSPLSGGTLPVHEEIRGVLQAILEYLIKSLLSLLVTGQVKAVVPLIGKR